MPQSIWVVHSSDGIFYGIFYFISLFKGISHSISFLCILRSSVGCTHTEDKFMLKILIFSAGFGKGAGGTKSLVTSEERRSSLAGDSTGKEPVAQPRQNKENFQTYPDFAGKPCVCQSQPDSGGF